MNYIMQLNEFYKNITADPLTSNAKNLYETLLHINSDSYWREEITVANTYLILLTGLNKQKIDRARNELIQRNFIQFKKGINQSQAGKYRIIKLYVQNNTADDTPNDTPNDTADNTATDTINKQNKTKQYIDHFELIWDKYPNKQGKAKALEYYLAWIKGRKISSITKQLTDRQMYYAVIKYAKECEEKQIEQQYIKHGDTFFNKAILDYAEVEDEPISGD